MSRTLRTKDRCLLIAEAGVNHNGKFSLAKKMVRAAVLAGADYIKFQTFDPQSLVTAALPKVAYQKKSSSDKVSQRKMLQKLALSRPEFLLLKRECHRQSIGFLSTAFDPESLKFVESLRPDFHKISSGDIDNIPFLRQVAHYGRPVILSTGMATLGEIQRALQTLRKAGLARSKVIILQCHTEYPTRPSEANLRAMDTLRQRFGVKTGLSDHTSGIHVGLAAVARGAVVLEKHFTLNRAMVGPDHRASLSPGDLGRLAQGIREVEAALGDPRKRPTPREMKIKNQVRKFLVARQPIRKGEKLTRLNLCLKRSGGGIPASRWDFYVGQRSRRNYQPDETVRP